MSGGGNNSTYFFDDSTIDEYDVANVTNTSSIDNYYYYETEQLATLGVLLTSIVLGNISVLLALSLTKRRKNRVNFFIQHLALADLSVGLVNVLTDLVWKLTLEWNAGNKTCKLVRYSQGVVTYSSTYVLVALTIDRYDAIRHPMNFSSGHRKARYLVAIAWMLSCFFSTPLLYLFELKLVQNRFQCWIDLPQPVHWQLYLTLVSITLFFIPAVIIATCYSIIIYTIWTKGSKLIIKPMKTCNTNGTSMDSDTKRVSSRGIIPKAKVKTVKMTLVIVFVFIACWSPYMVYNLLQVYGVIGKTQTTIAIATFIQSLAPLNSAVNPIIYWCFSTYICRDFRSKPQWMESLTGRSNRLTTSTNMSLSLSSTRLRTYQLHPITPAERKLIIRTVSVRMLVNEGLSERAWAFGIERLVLPADKGDKVLWHKGIGVELCSQELWQQFAAHGTEMLLTKAGRRMFPTLKVRFYGLSPSATYVVYMDALPVGRERFRYLHHSSEWITSRHNPHMVYDDELNAIYIHPDSPASGFLWTSQAHVSFHQVKINNNKAKASSTGQISLESMRKYLPRVNILELPVKWRSSVPSLDQLIVYIRHNVLRASVFTFPVTAFITVTAYQNQHITHLKVTTNPFAKGYREIEKNRKKTLKCTDEQCSWSSFKGKLAPVKVIFPPKQKLTYLANNNTIPSFEVDVVKHHRPCSSHPH